MKKTSRILSALLAVILIFSCAEITVYAEQTQDTGKAGENISYVLSSDGTLTVKGKGKMYSWEQNGSPFSDNKEIEKVIIENGVEDIGSYAFSGCINLKEAILPPGLTRIGRYAFYDCTLLKNINLPMTVEEIGSFAFGLCVSIESICIPDSTANIKDGAFIGDSGIKDIYMGSGIEDVGSEAFSECSGIEHIYVRDTDLAYTEIFGEKQGQESVFAVKPQKIKTGDADLDGSVTAADARMILRCSAGLENIINAAFSDMNSDNILNDSDVKLILRDTVGLAECRFHTFEEKEVIMPDGTKEIHRVCINCCRDTDAIPEIGGPMAKTFADIFSDYGAMSAGVGIVEDGELKASYSYGWAEKSSGRYFNSDTKLRAASTSKLLVCITFMAMKDAGLVDDEADISDYFGYKCRNPYFPDEIITPAMIMTHSSGINGDYSNGNTYYLPDNALSTYAPYTRTRPGTVYEYCNSGLGVLACLMEKVSGKYLSELVREYVFDKMGIDAAFDAAHLADPDKIGCLYGGFSIEQVKNRVSRELGHSLNLASGNLLISPKDYARVLAMLINDGRAEDGTVILSPERVEEIEKIRIYGDYEGAPGSYGVGYGIQHEDTVLPGVNVITHIGSGRGMHAAYVYNPEDRTAIYVMTTGCDYNLDPECEVYRVCLDVIRAYYSFRENKS